MKNFFKFLQFLKNQNDLSYILPLLQNNHYYIINHYSTYTTKNFSNNHAYAALLNIYHKNPISTR
jgi:uncharacterized protein VirK/YbjX